MTLSRWPAARSVTQFHSTHVASALHMARFKWWYPTQLTFPASALQLELGGTQELGEMANSRMLHHIEHVTTDNSTRKWSLAGRFRSLEEVWDHSEPGRDTQGHWICDTILWKQPQVTCAPGICVTGPLLCSSWNSVTIRLLGEL